MGDVYGLDSLFDSIDELGLECPTSYEELLPLLEEHIYYENDFEAEPHFVHVETNDDEVDIEYFFFDDVYLRSPEALGRLPSAERDVMDEDEDFDGDNEEEDGYARFLRKVLGS